MATPTALELERNDIPGALKVYRAAIEDAETATELGDTVTILIMLQDDPDELMDEMGAIDDEPEPAAKLLALGLEPYDAGEDTGEDDEEE